MNFTLALAGLGVGIIVGLTGMGGGALMTPILVLVFGVPPVAAVSSDLAASAVMKPFGGFGHAADAQPEDQPPVDRAPARVHRAPDRLQHHRCEHV